MNLKFSKQADRLKKLFESELDSFPINKQWHYSERLFRITGNKKYIERIRKYWITKTPAFRRLIEAFGNPQKEKALGLRYVKNLEKYKSPRLQKRVPIYREIPEFKYYQELVWFLNRAQDYNIESTFSKSRQNELRKGLQHVDFDKYFRNEVLMLADPVQTVNTLFFLRNIGIGEYLEETISFIKELFKEKKTSEQYSNKLYSYTHILISESRYYQEFLDPQTYEWIYEFLQEEMPKILKLKNNDIIGEIGVCLKLARIENHALEKIQKKISNELSKYGGILLRKKSNKQTKLEKVEHRNVLAILLLSPFEKLYKGPNLNL